MSKKYQWGKPLQIFDVYSNFKPYDFTVSYSFNSPRLVGATRDLLQELFDELEISRYFSIQDENIGKLDIAIRVFLVTKCKIHYKKRVLELLKERDGSPEADEDEQEFLNSISNKKPQTIALQGDLLELYGLLHYCHPPTFIQELLSICEKFNTPLPL